MLQQRRQTNKALWESSVRFVGAEGVGSEIRLQIFRYGFYNHFNNLRFKQSQHILVFSAAHMIIMFVPSESQTCRLLK